jgi:TatD DNase family protein
MTYVADSKTDVSAQWVDFHCHLDLYPDPNEVAADAERDGVRTLAVTTTPRAWPRESEMFEGFRCVRLALGLHPELVAEHAHEIRLWERYLEKTRYVGEVGLDARPRGRPSLPQQKAVFRRMLEICAERGGKILTVHSAGIPGDTVRMIAEHLPADRGRVVLHWFVGSKKTTNLAVDHGCFFSVNAAMLESQRARNTITAIPRDRILTETDGPFTQCENRPAKPSDVPHTITQLARFLDISPRDLGKQIQANLKTLLS